MQFYAISFIKTTPNISRQCLMCMYRQAEQCEGNAACCENFVRFVARLAVAMPCHDVCPGLQDNCLLKRLQVLLKADALCHGGHLT